MDNKQIGTRIKSRRKELKFTLQEVADKVGVASSTIQRYESGRISQYKLPVLESIAKAINVNPTWLVKEDAPMNTDISDDVFVKENKMITKELEPIHCTLKLSDFVTPQTQKLSKEEITLLDNFNKLNDIGKKEANKRVAELTCIPMYSNSEITATIDSPEKTLEDMYGTIAAHDDDLTEDEKEDMNRRILDGINKLHKSK